MAAKSLYLHQVGRFTRWEEQVLISAKPSARPILWTEVAIEDRERQSCHHPKLNLIVRSRRPGHEFLSVGVNIVGRPNAVTVD